MGAAIGIIGPVLGLAGGLIQGIGAAGAAKANAAQILAQSIERAAGIKGQAAQMYAESARTLAQGKITAGDYADEAALHDRQAQLLRVSGSYDAARATEKGVQLTSAQQGGFAANGLAVKGSIADLVKTTAQSAGLDIRTSRYGATMGVRNEQLIAKVNRKRSVDTLHIAGQTARDLARGAALTSLSGDMALSSGAQAAKAAGDSASLAFLGPIISAGGSVLRSSFA